MLPELARIVPERALMGDEIAIAADALLDPAARDKDKAAFLSTWAQRGETADELAACAEAFLPRAVDPGVRGSWNGRPLLDCCGTGGGGLNIVNISTGVMFILAAMGVPVVKHGNRGVTKRSGSADVLEALGIRVDLPPAEVPRCLEEVGCAFLFAPSYHPAFAVIAPVRRTLAAQGQRTIFNLLGPLLNPARPEARLVGVFKPEHVALYHAALRQMHAPRYTVVYGTDASARPVGEVSAHGTNQIASTLSWKGEKPISLLQFEPYFDDDPSTKLGSLDDLLVSDAAQSAARLLGLLGGTDRGLGRDMLVLNATVAAWTQGIFPTYDIALTHAREAIDSGAAFERLKAWQHLGK
jgi:anthranilate phosphoribosyltransferase